MRYESQRIVQLSLRDESQRLDQSCLLVLPPTPTTTPIEDEAAPRLATDIVFSHLTTAGECGHDSANGCGASGVTPSLITCFDNTDTIRLYQVHFWIDEEKHDIDIPIPNLSIRLWTGFDTTLPDDTAEDPSYSEDISTGITIGLNEYTLASPQMISTNFCIGVYGDGPLYVGSEHGGEDSYFPSFKSCRNGNWIGHPIRKFCIEAVAQLGEASRQASPDNSPSPADSRLRLHWTEEKPHWQGTKDEVWLCMACANQCTEGERVILRDCRASAYQQFHGMIDHTLRPSVNQNLCLTVTGYDSEETPVTLLECDGRSDQQFLDVPLPVDSEEKFMLRPKDQGSHCLTQEHHPKEGEPIYPEDCSMSLKDGTAFWIQY